MAVGRARARERERVREREAAEERVSTGERQRARGREGERESASFVSDRSLPSPDVSLSASVARTPPLCHELHIS